MERQTDAKIDQVNKRIDKCATKDDAYRLKEDSKHFVRDKDMLDLKNVVLPLCKQAEKDLTEFSIVNREVQESVLRFDKILC